MDRVQNFVATWLRLIVGQGGRGPISLIQFKFNGYI